MSATTSIPIPRHAGRTRPGRAGRLLRGPQSDPRWARPALLGLLALTALLYLWDLGRNGWANDFYAAAVQAGTKSWKAFFFGSFDQSSFITVDKTPGSLWVMELSGRIFGFSQWSMLAPQALEGVGSVLLLYAAVKRWFGPAAGLIAGLVLALTPAAALMFRFNNPDALLVLLMTAAAYTLVRAVENGRTRWLVFTGAADRVRVPGQDDAGVPGGAGVRRRLPVGRTAPAGQADLADAADGSRHRRRRGLVDPGRAAHPGGGPALLRRLDHQQHPAARHRLQRPGPADWRRDRLRRPGGGGGQGASFGGTTGIFRLFHAEFGGQISWLLPAALISLAAMAWVSRRAARTDRTRAAALLWGGWVLVTGLVFSYMNGIIHPYYMVALAPGIAALVGIGAMALWQPRRGRRRGRGRSRGRIRALAGRIATAAGVLASAVWAYILLDRTPDWLPWLRWVVLVAGVAAAGLVLAGPALARLAAVPGSRRARLALAAAPLGLALVAGLAGPAAYALDTVGTAHTGAIPSAGRASADLGGGRAAVPAARAASPVPGSPAAAWPGPGARRTGARRDRRPAGREQRAAPGHQAALGHWAEAGRRAEAEHRAETRRRAEPVRAGCRGAVPTASAPGTGRAAAAWVATPR